VLVLCHYAFQVHLGADVEQLLPAVFEMIDIQQRRAARWNYRTQDRLTFNERQVAQVLTIQPQDVESVVARFQAAAV
jgi:hypothetical protein